MNKTFILTDKNGVSRKFEILNAEYYNDMVTNAKTPEAAVVWLALGELAGHIKEV